MNPVNDNQNNLKDTQNSTTQSYLAISDGAMSLSYKKTNKLVTAVYMVTDMLDAGEPIRLKLRTLGTEVLSDTISLSRTNLLKDVLSKKIQEILHFLDLSETINLVSVMNASILKKEFLELQKSVEEYAQSLGTFSGKSTLSEFLNPRERFSIIPPIERENYPIGHQNSTHIGVQKGGTLLKALSDRITTRPIEKSATINRDLYVPKNTTGHVPNKEEFAVLKKQRQDAILRIIKDTKGMASIAEIKSHPVASSMSFSEKTLQRELVSMTENGVLKKTGSKRWSRYSIL
ncbi:MAG: hypothetical protein M3Q34_04285 [bacterium]|nr:hypothetical protein [bacterium]